MNNQLLQSITSTEIVMEQMRDILLKLTPSFADEEKSYAKSIRMIKETLGEDYPISLDDLITASERRIATNLVFLGWQGLHLNLSCYKIPRSKQFLRLDYEEIHKESLMNSFPASVEAESIVTSFTQSLPEACKELTDSITSYYAYWETVAYKLAHYFGFRFGDDFLSFVVPGYVPDAALTMAYAQNLSNYLGINLQ